MSLINSSYFIGNCNVPNTENDVINTVLDTYIRKYEQVYLQQCLGYELFKALSTALLLPSLPQRMAYLLFGKEYTNSEGRLTYWPGLVSVTTPMPQVTLGLLGADDIVFVVGGSNAPAAGATIYTNTDLAGKSYRVSQRGYGLLEALKDDNSNASTADINIISTGGFSLRNGVTFINADKYFVTLTTAAFDASSVNTVPLPESPIAYYVYYHWQKYNQTTTTTIGEKKSQSQNTTDDSPVIKMVEAWNYMVSINKKLDEYLLFFSNDYPEYNGAESSLLTYKNRYQ